jgi:ankyrin repeat protein
LIIAACIRGDVAQLRRWEQRGIRRQIVKYLVECAASGVSLDVLRFFVEELGADVNGKSQDGHTPLHAAAKYGHLDALRCLGKEFRADVNSTSRRGSTPLLMAAQDVHLLAASYLGKELGADVNNANIAGCTPFTRQPRMAMRLLCNI